MGVDRCDAAAAGAAGHVRARLSLPAFEILRFQFLVNRANRYLGSGREDYRVNLSTIGANLKSGWGTDNDPFEINQLGHPYQGATYYGPARSTGQGYWESAGCAFAGNAMWDIAGERTNPSRNDQVPAASAAPSSAKRCVACPVSCSSRAAA